MVLAIAGFAPRLSVTYGSGAPPPSLVALKPRPLATVTFSTPIAESVISAKDLSTTSHPPSGVPESKACKSIVNMLGSYYNNVSVD